MTGFTDDEARSFARSFRDFLQWVHQERDPSSANEVVALVRDHLGETGRGRSVVSRSLPPVEHVNLQTALDAWTVAPGRTVQVRGIVIPPHYGPVTMLQLISGDGLPPLRLAAPPLVDLPNGPGSTLACLQRAVLLVDDARGRYVVLVAAPSENDDGLRLEVAGLDVADAQAVQTELAVLRSRLNVYRGHVLDVEPTPYGGISLTFADVPTTARAAVILPEQVLARIERHALGVSTHRDALLRAGQHLKRGLLLFGPPGTGKTHTTRYLVGRMAGYTRLLLAGRSLHTIGAVAEMARGLQPAVVVLEDVDLVAEDRSFGPGTNSVLFDLLDAMDGAAADADLLFVLTTNRADLLEPALAARPGRVDVAVEIGLPDAEARRALFLLYARGLALALDDADLDDLVARSEGVTASFLKELVRRAVLERLDEAGELGPVTAAQTNRALDDLLDTTQQVTRSLLGVGSPDRDAPVSAEEPEPGVAPGPPRGVAGYGPGRSRGQGWFRGGGQ